MAVLVPELFFSEQAVVLLGSTVVPLGRYFRYVLPLSLPLIFAFWCLQGSLAIFSGSTALPGAVVPLQRYYRPEDPLELLLIFLSGNTERYCRPEDSWPLFASFLLPVFWDF